MVSSCMHLADKIQYCVNVFGISPTPILWRQLNIFLRRCFHLLLYANDSLDIRDFIVYLWFLAVHELFGKWNFKLNAMKLFRVKTKVGIKSSNEFFT